jgi:hypothetical protein
MRASTSELLLQRFVVPLTKRLKPSQSFGNNLIGAAQIIDVLTNFE